MKENKQNRHAQFEYIFTFIRPINPHSVLLHLRIGACRVFLRRGLNSKLKNWNVDPVNATVPPFVQAMGIRR